MNTKSQEELRSMLPGDKVLRIRRRRQMRPRLLSWSEVVGVIKEIIFGTPLFVMVPILLVLLLLFSAGIFFAENGAAGSNANSYGEALWDGVVLMTTAGTMSEPVTLVGHIIGGIWTILGCLLFYGTIIASASAYFLLPISSYFLLPRRSEVARLVGSIQYNFGRIEQLSTSDLEALREMTNKAIDDSLQRHQKTK